MTKAKLKKEAQALAKRGQKLVKQIFKDPLVRELVASEKKLLQKTIKRAVDRAKKKIKSKL